MDVRSAAVRHAGSIAIVVTSCLFGLVLAALPFAIDQFSTLFTGFGTDLPEVTQKLMSLSTVDRLRLFWPGAAAQLLFSSLHLMGQGSSVRTLLRLVTAYNAVILCGVIVALYWPIFRLGQAL